MVDSVKLAALCAERKSTKRIRSFHPHLVRLIFHDPLSTIHDPLSTPFQHMDFSLTEQQRQFCDSIAAFARKELAEGAMARAHAPEFPRDVAQRMAKIGLLGITIPEADGAASGSTTATAPGACSSRLTSDSSVPGFVEIGVG